MAKMTAKKPTKAKAAKKTAKKKVDPILAALLVYYEMSNGCSIKEKGRQFLRGAIKKGLTAQQAWARCTDSELMIAYLDDNCHETYKFQDEDDDGRYGDVFDTLESAVGYAEDTTDFPKVLLKSMKSILAKIETLMDKSQKKKDTVAAIRKEYPKFPEPEDYHIDSSHYCEKCGLYHTPKEGHRV